ncbi:MAG: glutamate-1-semialdehyde 2,1-aminomutase [Chitinispirillaceae bacterium]|nr:glutamate-1-semialdehyde 2,1-aminomutase [Chitinispirillaceae bacterium]
MPECKRSLEAFERAKRLMPGGVNSPVRAFRAVGGVPRFFISGEGAWLTDIDKNQYLDFVGSWGPMLLGHAHPAVVEAITAAAGRGSSFGAPTEAETELVERIVAMVPSIEMVRLVNSGTEAAMSAVRLARGVTKRDLVVKFEGCYHGHGDSFLIAAGSGALTFGTPDSPGVPSATARKTLLARFNDIDSVSALFERHGTKIAACIVEPVAGNMGVVPPKEGFLNALRDITKQRGALLIFDEVMTGFRVAPGGAQERYGVFPDITTLGKIIGGGMPVGAYGGSRDLMEHISPAGPIYQAGTLSGNPVAVASGLATLRVLRETQDLYGALERKSARLAQGIEANCRTLGIPAIVNRVGSMMTLFFTGAPAVDNFEDAKTADTKRFGAYFHASLDEGIYLPPSQFEAMFVSASHRDADINLAIEKNRCALQKVGEQA